MPRKRRGRKPKIRALKKRRLGGPKSKRKRSWKRRRLKGKRCRGRR